MSQYMFTNDNVSDGDKRDFSIFIAVLSYLVFILALISSFSYFKKWKDGVRDSIEVTAPRTTDPQNEEIPKANPENTAIASNVNSKHYVF
jgi:hypothetical protein